MKMSNTQTKKTAFQSLIPLYFIAIKLTHQIVRNNKMNPYSSVFHKYIHFQYSNFTNQLLYHLQDGQEYFPFIAFVNFFVLQ